MFKFLLRFRYITLVIVLFTSLNAVGLIWLGATKAIQGYVNIVTGNTDNPLKVGMSLLESMDMFLIALVFLIFSIGLTKLFVFMDSDAKDEHIPSWLNVDSFLKLKLLLWEAIITAMVISFITEIAEHGHNLNWSILVMPTAILILTVSLYVIKNSE